MRNAAIRNITTAKGIFDDLNVTFWLEAGTLLKAYRDGEIDTSDIDVSVYEEGFREILLNLQMFLDRGFRVIAIYSNPSGKASQIALERDGIHLDIWQKLFRNKRAWWVSYKLDEELYIPHHVDEKHCITLDTLEIWDNTWNIPHDVEEYLEAAYGDWKTPNPDWVWWRDPKCIDYDWEIK